MPDYFETGFGARKGAWHGYMTVVAEELTAAAAIIRAGMNFEVDKVPMFIAVDANGTPLVGDITVAGSTFRMAEDAFAIVRRDKGTVLGTVGAQYQVFQNADAFGFLDDAIGKGLASFHTAGVLKGGRHVWIQCRLPGKLGTDLDPVEKFLTISTAHDGSKAVHVMVTPVRVVCWNTLNMAWGDHKGFSMRHTRNITDRVIDAQRLIADSEERLEEFEGVMTQLQQAAFSDDQFRALIMNIMPPPEKAQSLDDVPTARQNSWNAMFRCFKGGKGASLETAKNTAWGAVNAVAEFTDWERTTRGNGGDPDNARVDNANANRFRAAMWGSGAQLKQKAADLVYEYVTTDGASQSGWIPDPQKSLAEQILLP